MTKLSVLDLAPIVQGGDAAQAFANSVSLARTAERLGYERFWLAEHHNMKGIASAATSVVMGHVAGQTKTIRIGAGGIMLPNHAPLVIAEQFGTLASLYPDRIDLGIGRAPGTDPLTAQALRRTLSGNIDDFPRDVIEILQYLGPDNPDARVRAVPGYGANVPVWILGSSTYGAQLAAALGLPYAFASHFAPGELDFALELYRRQFKPSAYLEKPYVMAGFNIFAAETTEEAKLLFTSLQQAFVNLRTGNPGQLPPPVEGYGERLDPAAAGMLAHALSCAAVGDRDVVRAGLQAFIARTGADEVIVTAQIFDHAARLRSFEIAAEVHANLARAA
ncbi:MAG TPA: LLM class flavin-dependent oxidoreductase [Caulobacter sp.]|nr:LLM class flavin-dependent oxidoreductase [Caulobacter sp.]